MTVAGTQREAAPAPSDPFEASASAVAAAERLLHHAKPPVRTRTPAASTRAQPPAHGLAWLATYVEACAQLAALGAAPRAKRPLRRDRALLLAIGFGEYLAQIAGGIPMSQGEIVRLPDARRLAARSTCARFEDAVATLIAAGNTRALPAPGSPS